jgi:hypothetical protein
VANNAFLKCTVPVLIMENHQSNQGEKHRQEKEMQRSIGKVIEMITEIISAKAQRKSMVKPLRCGEQKKAQR